jgi:hypothetical protein
MFPDLIHNLAVILLKPGYDSLRLSEVAPVARVRPGTHVGFGFS